MASIRFEWQHEDPHPGQVHFRLYEDGEMAVDNIGQMNFELLMAGKPQGEYVYTVTAVRFGLESQHSEPVTANFTRPAAPTGFSASWAG